MLLVLHVVRVSKGEWGTNRFRFLMLSTLPVFVLSSIILSARINVFKSQF